MTLCLSQGFVFSAHIALKSHCLLVILRWSWPVRKAASATYTGSGLLTFDAGPIQVRLWWVYWRTCNSIGANLQSDRACVCVCICLVHQVAHPSFGEQCLFTSTLIVLLLLRYFLPLLSWFLGHFPWSILHIQYILFFPWLFCIRLTHSFAFHLSIILWVALEKYLFIHLGKRKYICQMRNKCVHIERL